MIARKGTIKVVVLALVGAAAAVWMLARPAFPQDPAYHAFVDQRPLLGIPHCLNVISNAPFLVVGVLGLAWRRRWQQPFSGPSLFLTPYGLFFLGIALTAFGSTYYHLDPTNDRLLWDRLPMAVAFMALFAAILGERISVPAGARLLGPLVVVGLASVVYWHWSEQHGQGDLRFYHLVQFYPMLAIPLVLLLYPPRYTRTADWFLALGLYVLAKIVEHHDGEIYALGVSGHTLKHLLAALGAYAILHMLVTRRSLMKSALVGV
jgi:hypothetical protein